MFFSHFNILIFIYFCSFSWTSTIENDYIWPWAKTKYLTRSNWSTLLIPNDNNSFDDQHSIWFIFHSQNSCEYSKKFEPVWEDLARYAINWSKYIQIGTYDCTNESLLMNDICQDKEYPHGSIYCPLTNTIQLAFYLEQKLDNIKFEDILIYLLNKLNKIANQCYGESWPIKNIIESKTNDDLNKIIPKNINKFQLFISDDILLYTLYVLNNSKTIQTEPIYHLTKENQITQNIGIWKGIRYENGQIYLQSINSENIMKSLVVNQNIISYLEIIKQKTTATPKPTLSDIDSAVVWMLTRDLRRKLPSLFGDVKSWVDVLSIYYPGSDTVKNFLYDLNTFLKNRTTLTSTELQNYINSTSTIKLPELKFDHCNGSDSTKRGYPCTLWILFHSMTIKQAQLAEQNKLSSDVKPFDLMLSIRQFIGKFFLCQECVTHFINMTSNAENEINSYNESVLYLWRSHNIVNKRLRYENDSNDPDWPKVPFPTKQQCNLCVEKLDENGDGLEYNENEVYHFLKGFYYFTNSVRNQSYNHVLLVFIVIISRLVLYQ
ncbi:unnamed protein product [Rotaria sordida]|uniref:Sulfhydryl oxidase n=1 Tax=Rotaria sordida TaxID=392033 RepID=A0A814UCC7_9BILA|nr:unnamed protein product [Rotaria sordida]CAF1431497.1 unnamed protein product [Rotaria sordida]